MDERERMEDWLDVLIPDSAPKETRVYDLGDDWEAKVWAESGMLKENMVLTWYGDRCWEMEIPAGMDEAELISKARMIARIYQKGYTQGEHDARKEAVEYLGGVMGT